MALKGQAIIATYRAWNTGTNTGQAGDAANHSLFLIQDGVQKIFSSPMIVDLGSGLYSVVISATDMSYDSITLRAESLTTNVVIMPVMLLTDAGFIEEIRNKQAANSSSSASFSSSSSPSSSSSSLSSSSSSKSSSSSSFSSSSFSSSSQSNSFSSSSSQEGLGLPAELAAAAAAAAEEPVGRWSAGNITVELGSEVDVFQDRSGNYNHLKPPASGPASGPTRVNLANGVKGLTFDGLNSCVGCEPSGVFDFVFGEITIIMVVGFEPPGQGGRPTRVFSKRDDVGWELLLDRESGTVTWRTAHAALHTAAPSCTAMAKVAMDGGLMLLHAFHGSGGHGLYVNGAGLTARCGEQGSLQNGAALYLGGDDMNSQYGDRVRMYLVDLGVWGGDLGEEGFATARDWAATYGVEYRV